MSFDGMVRKQKERVAEFKSYGITPSDHGGLCLGEIAFYASDAEKILQLLRRLKKLDAKAGFKKTSELPPPVMGTEEARIAVAEHYGVGLCDVTSEGGYYYVQGRRVGPRIAQKIDNKVRRVATSGRRI